VKVDCFVDAGEISFPSSAIIVDAKGSAVYAIASGAAEPRHGE
jgi:hypothetical protein